MRKVLIMSNYTSKSNEIQSIDMPKLPQSALLPPANLSACDWLRRYIHFSEEWAPRSYSYFHEGIGLWLLSTIAARRVQVNLGGPRYSNLYIALVARTSLYSKSTCSGIALQTLYQSGLYWLLASDSSTPQKYLSDLGNHYIDNFDELSAEQQEFEKRRAATAGQRGWYYEEFGDHIRSMMEKSGLMADFRGILRRFDDTPLQYKYSTIQRGSEVADRPYLALQANLTPDDLRPHARSGAALWGDGFLARFGLITPPEDGPLSYGHFPEGERKIPEEIIRPLVEWNQRLGLPEMTLHNTDVKGRKLVRCGVHQPQVLDMEIAAKEAHYAYHDGLLEAIHHSENHDLDGNYARFAEKALRIAMLLASIENNSKILLIHLAAAEEITEHWRIGLHQLYSQVNQRKQSTARDKENNVIQVIERHGAMTPADVKKYIRDMSSTEVKKIMDELVEVGVIELGEKTRSGTYRYQLVEEYRRES